MRGRLEETREATRRRGTATPCALDITASYASGFGDRPGESLATFGRLDVLVHAAGVFLPKPFEDDPIEDFDLQWQTNVRAPFVLTQAALPHLRSGGSVIFVSSISGLVGFPNSVAYCSTKGAVELMSKALTVELAGEGIRFNCIAPGNIRTPMNEHLLVDPEYERAMLAVTPAGPIGEVGDVTGVAVFLASDASGYMNGSTVVVDGGWTAG